MGFKSQKAKDDRNVDGGTIHSEQSFKLSYTEPASDGQDPPAPNTGVPLSYPPLNEGLG